MNLELFKTKLKHALKLELPGFNSHLKLAPKERIEGIIEQINPKNARSSAVLIVLYQEENQLKIIFILRSVYNGAHSGQISFPGGKYEIDDVDLIETALRETKEEIGISISKEQVLGKLSNIYIPPSNFMVDPYIAIIENIEGIKLDSTEVQQIYKVAFSDFLKANIIKNKEVLAVHEKSIKAPCFVINDLNIWGATAMILKELLDVIESNNLEEYIT